MSPADTSLFGIVPASFDTASLHLCPVPSAYSSFDNNVGASITTADFVIGLCSVSNAHSSLLGFVGTSFMIAFFDLRPMSDAGTSLQGPVGAPFMTAFTASLLRSRSLALLLHRAILGFPLLLLLSGSHRPMVALDFDPLDGLESILLSADKVLVPPRPCVGSTDGGALEAPKIELPSLFRKVVYAPTDELHER